MAAFLIFAGYMIRRGPDLSPAQTEASGSVKNALRPQVMDGAAGRHPILRCGAMTMNLPLLSALFATFALTLYVMLDGFDLGVGALLLVQPDEKLARSHGRCHHADLGWQ